MGPWQDLLDASLDGPWRNYSSKKSSANQGAVMKIFPGRIKADADGFPMRHRDKPKKAYDAYVGSILTFGSN